MQDATRRVAACKQVLGLGGRASLHARLPVAGVSRVGMTTGGGGHSIPPMERKTTPRSGCSSDKRLGVGRPLPKVRQPVATVPCRVGMRNAGCSPEGSDEHATVNRSRTLERGDASGMGTAAPQRLRPTTPTAVSKAAEREGIS